MNNCPREFEESLLSGFVDRELSQGDEQRVRLHLEACQRCAALVRDLQGLRGATRGTRFRVPSDGQWSERPRSPASYWLRLGGWVVLLAWALVAGAFALWQVSRESIEPLELVIGLGAYVGLGLVFLSVLLDRIKARRTDRYRRVEK